MAKHTQANAWKPTRAPHDDSPYLTGRQAACYLQYPDTRSGYEAFRMWAKRQLIPPCRVGRRRLYLRSDLDAVLQQSRAAFVAAAETMPTA